MNFTEILQGKIKARRAGPNPQVLAKVARETRFRTLGAPVINAIEAMRDRLFEDPLFAEVVGRPEVGMETWNEEGENGATLSLKGRLTHFSILVNLQRDQYSFRIYPNLDMTRALNCSTAGYSSDSGIKGHSKDLNAFIIAIEDHVADFIADVVTTPAANVLL